YLIVTGVQTCALPILSKNERYYYDAEAIKEESVTLDPRRPYGSEGSWQLDGRPAEQRPNGKLRKRSDPVGGVSHKERGQHSEGRSEERRVGKECRERR